MPSKPWEQWELDLIRRDYPSGGAEALADVLGRSADSIRCKAYSLHVGMTNPHGKQPPSPFAPAPLGAQPLKLMPCLGFCGRMMMTDASHRICCDCRGRQSRARVLDFAVHGTARAGE